MKQSWYFVLICMIIMIITIIVWKCCPSYSCQKYVFNKKFVISQNIQDIRNSSKYYTASSIYKSVIDAVKKQSINEIYVFDGYDDFVMKSFGVALLEGMQNQNNFTLEQKNDFDLLINYVRKFKIWWQNKRAHGIIPYNQTLDSVYKSVFDIVDHIQCE